MVEWETTELLSYETIFLLLELQLNVMSMINTLF